MASTMQLEFSQAMSDFKTMFPDMDREVIEAVLRANQGAVDATIDQLLAMSTDNQNEKLRNELDGAGSPQQSLINLNDSETDLRRVNMQQQQQHQQQPATAQLIDTTDGSVGGTPVKTNNSAAIAANSVLLNLNSGGLGANASPHHHHNTGASPKQRPLGATNKTTATATSTPSRRTTSTTNTVNSSSSNNTNSTRRWNPPIVGPLPPGFLRISGTATGCGIAHDGTLRDFELPDEQFALMLQNEEFMNQLRWNQEFMNALEKEQSGKSKTEDDAAFKERLKNMGKLSRKKFLQMARVFTWQRNKKVTTAKQIDSLPLKEEPSDDEDTKQQHQHQHQQQQQQQQQHQQQQFQHQQTNVRK